MTDKVWWQIFVTMFDQRCRNKVERECTTTKLSLIHRYQNQLIFNALVTKWRSQTYRVKAWQNNKKKQKHVELPPPTERVGHCVPPGGGGSSTCFCFLFPTKLGMVIERIRIYHSCNSKTCSHRRIAARGRWKLGEMYPLNLRLRNPLSDSQNFYYLIQHEAAHRLNPGNFVKVA